VSELLSTNVF